MFITDSDRRCKKKTLIKTKDEKMITISCKNGRIFTGINEDFLDAETKLQIAYYKAQGCVIETIESFRFNGECDCEHCESLEHEFEDLIEQIIDEANS